MQNCTQKGKLYVINKRILDSNKDKVKILWQEFQE